MFVFCKNIMHRLLQGFCGWVELSFSDADFVQLFAIYEVSFKCWRLIVSQVDLINNFNAF